MCALRSSTGTTVDTTPTLIAAQRHLATAEELSVAEAHALGRALLALDFRPERPPGATNARPRV
jgi:hypothetical protein